MRNPERLDSFYAILKRIHKDYLPDWRVGQLFANFISAYGDIFYMEDDVLLQKLGEYIDAVSK